MRRSHAEARLLTSREPSHPAMFAWQTQFAGAARRIHATQLGGTGWCSHPVPPGFRRGLPANATASSQGSPERKRRDSTCMPPAVGPVAASFQLAESGPEPGKMKSCRHREQGARQVRSCRHKRQNTPNATGALRGIAHDRSTTSTSSPTSYRRPPAGSASRPAAPARPSRSDDPDQGSGVAARAPSEDASRHGR